MSTETTKTEKKPVKKAASVKKPVVKPVRAGGRAPVKKAAIFSKDDFSVIETGGKQYIVSVGDIIDVELLGDFKEGDKIVFDKVLMSDDGKSATIGNPYIKGAKVKATYVAFKKGKKLTIIRFKAKSNRDRRIGHRQKFSTVKIEALA